MDQVSSLVTDMTSFALATSPPAKHFYSVIWPCKALPYVSIATNGVIIIISTLASRHAGCFV